MVAAYSSRDIVEDFLRHKLLHSGHAWCRALGQRRLEAAATASTSACRAERAMTSHSGVPSEDTQQDPCLAPPHLQVVLRSAGDELERRYCGDLASHVSLLLQGNTGWAERRRRLTAVRQELFGDGVNWGRIIAMMELCRALCTELVKTGGAGQVDDIARWMEESLESPPLREWIEDNGGWDAFVELYGKPRQSPVRFWTLRTVFGLAALGAAGIILGVLFAKN